MPSSPYQSTNSPLQQGMLDELFPIEDGLLTLEHGSIKEARYVFEDFFCELDNCFSADMCCVASSKD